MCFLLLVFVIIAGSHTDSTSESGLQLMPAPYSMMSLWAWVSCSVDRLEEFVDLEKDFEEGIVNSSIFLIAMAMQLTNFAVNYHVSGTHEHSLPIPCGPVHYCRCVLAPPGCAGQTIHGQPR